MWVDGAAVYQAEHGLGECGISRLARDNLDEDVTAVQGLFKAEVAAQGPG